MEPCCGKQKVAISIILPQHKDWRHVPILLYSAEDVPTRPDDSLAGERVLLLPWNDHFFQKKKKPGRFPRNKGVLHPHRTRCQNLENQHLTFSVLNYLAGKLLPDSFRMLHLAPRINTEVKLRNNKWERVCVCVITSNGGLFGSGKNTRVCVPAWKKKGIIESLRLKPIWGSWHFNFATAISKIALLIVMWWEKCGCARFLHRCAKGES